MSDQPEVYSCPHCNGAVEITAGDVEHVDCPHCGEAFSVPREPAAAPADAELDAARIKKFAAVRRAAYRSRSYCVIGIGGCVVGAIDLVYHAVRVWGLGNVHGIAYIIVALGLLWGAKHFAVLAAQHHREAKRSALPPPTAPPDFSTLGDGSQIVRDLERM